MLSGNVKFMSLSHGINDALNWATLCFSASFASFSSLSARTFEFDLLCRLDLGELWFELVSDDRVVRVASSEVPSILAFLLREDTIAQNYQEHVNN